MVAAIVHEFNTRTLAVGECLVRMAGSWSALIGLFFLLALAATMAGVGWFVPINNWDMFAYLASAHEVNGITDAKDVHFFAYETIRQNVPAGDFLTLTQDRDYRVRQYADPDAFMSMLGFYRVKFLYIEMLAWLSRVVEPYQAIRLLSVVPAVGVALLGALWLWREKALHLGLLAVALFLALMYGDIAREGTPDALSSFLFIAGMMAFVARREALVAVLLFLAFLARPDHIAYTGVLMVVAIFQRSFSWGTAVAFIASLVAYVPITHAGGHPGWWVHFWFTNVEYVQTITGFHPDFSLAVYAKAQVRVLVRALVEETWLVVAIVGAAIWWQLILRGITLARRETAILVTTVLAIGAKMVIFPLSETRFWFPYLLVFGLVIIGALRDVKWLAPVSGRVR